MLSINTVQMSCHGHDCPNDLCAKDCVVVWISIDCYEHLRERWDDLFFKDLADSWEVYQERLGQAQSMVQAI